VTHDQEEALSIADHVVLIRDGRVVQSGTPKDLYERPANLWAGRFLGDLVELPADGDESLVSTPLGVLRVSDTVVDPVLAGGPPVAALRPEQIVADPLGEDCRVAEVTYFGHDAMVKVNVIKPGGGILPVDWRTSGVAVPQPGDAVRLRVAGPVRVFRG